MKTAAKLAYAAPIVAASMRMGTESAAATECPCPVGSVVIPQWVIDALRRFGFSNLANRLSGKCLGCTTGAIVVRTTTDLYSACQKVGTSYSRVCPGTGNRVALKDRACNPTISPPEATG